MKNNNIIEKRLCSPDGIKLIYNEDKRLYKLLEEFFSEPNLPNETKIKELNNTLIKEHFSRSIDPNFINTRFFEIKSSFAGAHKLYNNPPSPKNG